MGLLSLAAAARGRALRYALLATGVPVAIATADDFGAHHLVFFIGAFVACVVPAITIYSSGRRRMICAAAALLGIPALTMTQAYSGGVSSGYAVLTVMPMIWFGLQAADGELAAGMLLLAACSYLPMLMIGPPAYPIDWGHATVLVFVGFTVAGALRAITHEMRVLASRLQEEAVVDDLTGLLNRRGWRYNAPRELARSMRSDRPVALAIIDLDEFKSLNDTLGHSEGDRVLRETADRMQATLRLGDVLARPGGDEFVALLCNSTLEGALRVIARLRQLTPADGAFSAGVAVWDRGEDLTSLLDRADQALYAAKSVGGGTTDVAAPQRPSEEVVADGRQLALVS
jgi:diguanylate cyclase (GGDEF)-like protein